MKTKLLAAVSLAVPLVAGAASAAEEYATTTFTPAGWNALFVKVFRSVDLVGFVLLTLLVVLIGMCIDLFNHLRIGKLIPENLLTDVQEEMGNGEYEKALELCEKSNCLIGQIFAAALSKTDYSFDRMEDAMHAEVGIQGLVWRQWVGQFRIMALLGFLLGFVGCLIEMMRFIADLVGRPNVMLSLASTFEARQLAYGVFLSLVIGSLMAVIALGVYAIARSKLDKILLEAERLGEELLDPFRPLPMQQEELG